MPSLVQIKCQSCQRGPRVIWLSKASDHRTTRPEENPTDFWVGTVALEMNDGPPIRLLHPGEHRWIVIFKTTWEEALKCGRLLDLNWKICRQCGSLHEEHSVLTDYGKSIRLLALFPLTVLMMVFGFDARWPNALAVGFIITCVVLTLRPWIAMKIDAIKWRTKNKSLRIRQCSHCQNHDLLSLHQFKKQSLPCPHCGKNEMHFEFTNIIS